MKEQADKEKSTTGQDGSQGSNGQQKLEFTDEMVIEFNNTAVQVNIYQ